MEDERLHQQGPRFLKTMLAWAEQFNDRPILPTRDDAGQNVLFEDIAERLRARGLEAAVNYGFDRGSRIPLVVGLKGRPFALAVQTMMPASCPCSPRASVIAYRHRI